MSKSTLSALSLTFFITLGQATSWASGSEATLKVQRNSAWTASPLGMDGYVDGKKLGSVSNGMTREFTFEPKQDGTSYLALMVEGLQTTKSKTTEFHALPGSVVKAVATIELGFTENSISVEITTEKKGYHLAAAPPLQVVPSFQAVSNPSPVTPATKADYGPSWEAIGAIAGVLSVIIAFLAYYRKKEA